MACGTVDPRALVTSLIGVTDCHAAALGSEGWQALARSPLFAALLTGLLMIAVAWHGYRLLARGAGGGVQPVEAVALLIRIGAVIALTTSWQAYDRLIYRVATDGPAEIARATFPAAGVETEALGVRLQNAYDAIYVTPEERIARQQAMQNQPAANEAVPSPNPEAAASDLPGTGRNASATVLLVAGAGAWIATRFATALLLALGPLAIATLLFEASAGLCIGWLRALIGTALAALVVPLSLALELQMIEGPVRAAARTGSEDIPGLAPIMWIFVLVVAALVMVVQRVAGGLRLPRRRAFTATPPADKDVAVAAPVPAPAAPLLTLVQGVPAVPSRALAIAHAAEARAAIGRSVAVSVAHLPIATPATVPDRSRRGTELVDHARRASAGRRAVAGQRRNP